MAQYDEIVKHLMDRFADDFAMLSYYPEEEFIGWHVREVFIVETIITCTQL